MCRPRFAGPCYSWVAALPWAILSVAASCGGTTDPPEPLVDLQVSVVGGGSYSTSPPGNQFEAGTRVAITATPDEGSVLESFTGPCTVEGLTCTVTMTPPGPVAVTVNFIADTYYEVCAADKDPGDLNDPGNPPTTDRLDPFWYNNQTYDRPPPDFLQYDEETFDVFQRTMHNRTVTVAIQKAYELQNVARDSLPEFIFNTWALFWKEYGGFPFPFYTVVIGNGLKYDAPGVGAHGIGWEASEPWDWSGGTIAAHEIYHAWCGGAFEHYEDRRWFTEGVTVYYGVRQGEEYLQYMRAIHSRYDSAYAQGFDVPLDETRADGGIDDPFYLAAWKGALVAYLLDKRLSESGHHLGEVMRILYQRYGIESIGEVTTDQIQATAEEVSGTDFSDFFDNYIYGTEPLPLNGIDFDWVCHG